MKKIPAAVLVIFFIALAACLKTDKGTETVEENVKTYCGTDDGMWSCEGVTYQYRLEIKGRLPNAACDSVYVYLSNRPEISFEQAYKASGLSSSTADYFPPDEAVLVGMRTES